MQHMNVTPNELIGTDYESEVKKPLHIGDMVKVVVDSQFRDKNEPRRINQVGKIIEIDYGDEWAYRLEFKDGDNWFKRFHLRKIKK